MTLHDDGTCWDFAAPALFKELQARAVYGRVYNSPSMEEKRRAAIAWLREHSKRGYCVDLVRK